jgi:hypothetical protein
MRRSISNKKIESLDLSEMDEKESRGSKERRFYSGNRLLKKIGSPPKPICQTILRLTNAIIIPLIRYRFAAGASGNRSQV